MFLLNLVHANQVAPYFVIDFQHQSGSPFGPQQFCKRLCIQLPALVDASFTAQRPHVNNFTAFSA